MDENLPDDYPVRPFMVKADTLEESIRLTAERNLRDMQAQIGAFNADRETVEPKSIPPTAGHNPLWVNASTVWPSRLLISSSFHDCGCKTTKEYCEQHGKAPKPEPMTLERAVEVLNERRHLDLTGFYVYRDEVYNDAGYVYTSFEAIAIAEKYEREGK